MILRLIVFTKEGEKKESGGLGMNKRGKRGQKD